MFAFSQRIQIEQLLPAMNERQIAQAELATLIEKDKSSVSQYVSGKNIPKQDVQRKIADVLECSVEFLTSEVSANDKQGLRRVTIAETAKKIGKSKKFVSNSLLVLTRM